MKVALENFSRSYSAVALQAKPLGMNRFMNLVMVVIMRTEKFTRHQHIS